MKNTNFTEGLIKGKIAEIVFEQMFRETKKFTILPFGYETTLPEVAQYQQDVKNKSAKKVVDNIRHAPDFVLITIDHQQVYLVEVKYHKNPTPEAVLKDAQRTLQRWKPSWLFVASPKEFFFESCTSIENHKGKIMPLGNKWIPAGLRVEYLKLLNTFIP